MKPIRGLDNARVKWTWRRRSRPQLLAAIAEHADQATVEILTSRRAIEQWLHALGPGHTTGECDNR